MAAEQTALSYAVRGRVVAKYLGQLGLIQAGLMLVPIGVALSLGDAGYAWRCAEVAVLLFVVGGWLARLHVTVQVQVNEALVISALAFVLASLVMSWPFMGVGLRFVDAWFEAVSAVTTTGLSTHSQVSELPPAVLFSRAWMQWYGGLGIAVLWVALLFNHQHAMSHLAATTGTGSLVTTTHLHARRIVIIYSVLTLIGIALLLLLREQPLSAIAHTLSAVSTGGFAVYDNSLADMGVARYAVMLIALCGAVSLPLYYSLYLRNWRGFFFDTELRALLLISAIVCLLLWQLLLRSGMDAQAAFGHAVVMGISAQTTTGFSTLPVVDLDAAVKWVLLIAMIGGGCVGSTAGGLKMLRLLTLAVFLQLALRRSSMPTHAVIEPRLAGRRLQYEDIHRVQLIFMLYVVAVVLSWLPFLLMGYAPLDALLEVVSATSTVGLSTGITHATLETPLKWVLMADMLFGRVEFFALLLVLWPGTWFGKRDNAL